MQKSSSYLRKALFLLIFSVFSGISLKATGYGAETLRVVTTLPVLQDFVEVVGAPHVQVSSLISGLESEHTYTPKPSDMILIKKSKLLFKIGLGLETWVEALIKNADHPGLAVIVTSKNVPLIEEADHHDGEKSDHHAEGNPHIWLDPQNVKIMVAHIATALIAADPAHEGDYRKNTSNYLEKLDHLEKALLLKVSQLPDKKIMTHHPAWPYFAKRFGFEIKANILTQVGSEPSAKKMGTLIHLIQKEDIKVIVSEPQLNPKIPKILSEETGVMIVPLSPLPGALPGTEHYLDLIRYNVETLVSALKRSK